MKYTCPSKYRTIPRVAGGKVETYEHGPKEGLMREKEELTDGLERGS